MSEKGQKEIFCFFPAFCGGSIQYLLKFFPTECSIRTSKHFLQEHVRFYFQDLGRQCTIFTGILEDLGKKCLILQEMREF